MSLDVGKEQTHTHTHTRIQCMVLVLKVLGLLHRRRRHCRRCECIRHVLHHRVPNCFGAETRVRVCHSCGRRLFEFAERVVHCDVSPSVAKEIEFGSRRRLVAIKWPQWPQHIMAAHCLRAASNTECIRFGMNYSRLCVRICGPIRRTTRCGAVKWVACRIERKITSFRHTLRTRNNVDTLKRHRFTDTFLQFAEEPNIWSPYPGISYAVYIYLHGFACGHKSCLFTWRTRDCVLPHQMRRGLHAYSVLPKYARDRSLARHSRLHSHAHTKWITGQNGSNTTSSGHRKMHAQPPRSHHQERRCAVRWSFLVSASVFLTRPNRAVHGLYFSTVLFVALNL